MPDPVTIVLLGQPVPWARAGGRGKQRFTPTKQRNNAETLASVAQRAMWEIPSLRDVSSGLPTPLSGPLMLEVLAEVSIPKSWSKRMKNDAILHNIHPTGRPDLDNVVKQVKDALTSVVYRDDSLICLIKARKRYGVQPKLVITVSPLDGTSPVR